MNKKFKKRKRIYIMALLTVGLFVVSCSRNIDRTSVNEKGLVHMSVLFDHGVHQDVADAKGLNCLSCHPDKKALEPLLDGKPIGKIYECHDCHRSEAMLGQAIQRCNLCHVEMNRMIPADHRLDWMQRHAVFARVDQDKCVSCHDQQSCTDCHLQRDTIQQTVHPRTFMYTHSVEARANPHSCGSCHQVQMCRNCHIRKGIQF